jgi:RHS repeat-associated protein
MVFHQAYSYKDALGNFNGIFRNDLVKTNGSWALQNIDDNAYFYQNPLSSKISSILDYTGSPLGYKANSGTYTYDANGNTTYDSANKIATVYNYLNLPSKFTKDDGSKQEILYDFSGKKWQEIEFLATGDTLSKRSYLGSFEFEGNSLQKAFHSAGFVQNLNADVNSSGETNGNIVGYNIVSTQKLVNGGKSEYLADKSICLLPGFESLPIFNAEIKPQAGFQWNYILKDHLGNTRVLFTHKNGDGLIRQDTLEALNEVLSVTNYSPFGLELGGSHQNFKQQFDYKFNGKQDNGFSGLTDFGASYLDRSLGVWGQIDPSSEKYFPIGTRVFAANQPTKFIDPDGREIDVTGMDVYSQVQLILSLSRITGNNISIQEGKIVNRGKKSEEGSSKASAFLDYLIGSSQILYSNSVYNQGSYNQPTKNKEGDLVSSIFLNPYQIEETLQSFGETQGWGLTFLHEALHTGWASYFIDNSVDDGFKDPPRPEEKGHDPNLLGDTERVINEFRKELKLVEKSSYFNTINLTHDKKLINVTWKFGGIDKEIKPINKMNLFDKIIRYEINKNLRK